MSTAAIEGIAAPARSRRAADIWQWVVLPTTLVFCLIFAAPIADLCRLSFHAMTGPAQVGAAFTLANYRAFVTDPFYLQMLLRTGWLGLLVTLGCVAVGYPVAYFLARTPSRWRGMALFLVISPLLVSAIVRNIGWYPLLSESGLVNWALLELGVVGAPLPLINNFTGVVIGLVHALLPFMILTLTTVIQRIDTDLEEAAANLGAGPLEAFWRVLLPLSLPGVVSGSLLVFTMAISAYTTPAILGGNRVLVMATYIAQQFRTVLNYPAGATAAALLLLLAALLTLLALQVRTGDGGGRSECANA
ncbi:MAG TPA: ABC transporter permease [Xanthobacteraceae bacterium]|jgi:putative spermidine/putrescine transport system permease protein